MSRWIPVESSNLSRIRYNGESRALEIEFKGGRRYQYFDVPQVVFNGLKAAPSKGEYFNENIKGVYRYTRV
jgi:hypothetical protein